jgi:hypothetical protein
MEATTAEAARAILPMPDAGCRLPASESDRLAQQQHDAARGHELRVEDQ